MATALRLHQSGQHSQAADLYARVLEADPKHADAWHLAGVVAHQTGDHDTAVRFIRQALQLKSDHADFHLNAGSAHAALGQTQQAIAKYRDALALNPGSATAWNNLGNAYKELGQLDHAIEAYDKAIGLAPGDSHATANLGSSLLDLGRLEDAEKALERALSASPELHQARSNLGLVQTRQGKFDLAIENFAHVLSRQPNLSATWRNLRNCLNDVGTYETVEKTYKRVAADTDTLLQDMLVASVCPVIAESNDHISEYRDRLTRVVRIHEGASLLERADELLMHQALVPFYLPYQGRDDRPLKESYAAAVSPNGMRPLHEQFPSQRDGGKIRVGFPVSLDRHHLFLRFMQGLVDSLLESDDFEVVIPCAASNVSVLAESIHHGAELLPLPRGLRESAEAIAQSRCDILYFLEVGSDSLDYFLPFFSAAPVQATSWGIPVTSGIAQMDYFVSSDLIEPADGESHYRETLFRMKTLPVIYARPEVKPQSKVRSDFGFRDSDRIYGCLQSPFKNHPEFDGMLAGILRQDTAARIALVGGSHETSNATLQRRMNKSMPDVVSRVDFFPRMERDTFNDLARCCDVLLDTIHFGGGATSYEALAMGIPVVTLPGRFMRGRVTEGCYKKIGLSDCVASDPKDYVDRAVSLASDTDRNQDLRREIEQRCDILFNDPQAGHELADFLRSVAQDRRAA